MKDHRDVLGTGLNLVVIRAKDPKALARFYSLLGLQFAEEKHGAGPEHLSCDLDGHVFEIYPLANEKQGTTATRLGFRVESLPATIRAISAITEARVLRHPEGTKRGRRAVIVDPEGHRVELVEAAPA